MPPKPIKLGKPPPSPQARVYGLAIARLLIDFCICKPKENHERDPVDKMGNLNKVDE